MKERRRGGENQPKMTTSTEHSCDCTQTTPWPAMLSIHVGRKARRYYLCPRCGTVREDVARADGTTAVAHFYHVESANLPTTVAKRARDILAKPAYKQLSLFVD